MRHLTRIALTLSVLPLMAAPAALAADGDCRVIRGMETPETSDDVSVCREDNWFHQATTKLGNGAALDVTFPSWNTTRPTSSVAQGAGGAYLTNSLTDQSMLARELRATATFEGTYTGALDNIAVELYGLAGPLAHPELNIELVVGGWTLFDAQMVRVATTGDQMQRFRFIFTDVYAALVSNQGTVDPNGSMIIQLSVTGPRVVNDAIVFFYDSTEAPSGIVFNHEPGELGNYAAIDLAA